MVDKNRRKFLKRAASLPAAHMLSNPILSQLSELGSVISLPILKSASYPSLLKAYVMTSSLLVRVQQANAENSNDLWNDDVREAVLEGDYEVTPYTEMAEEIDRFLDAHPEVRALPYDKRASFIEAGLTLRERQLRESAAENETPPQILNMLLDAENIKKPSDVLLVNMMIDDMEQAKGDMTAERFDATPQERLDAIATYAQTAALRKSRECGNSAMDKTILAQMSADDKLRLLHYTANAGHVDRVRRWRKDGHNEPFNASAGILQNISDSLDWSEESQGKREKVQKFIDKIRVEDAAQGEDNQPPPWNNGRYMEASEEHADLFLPLHNLLSDVAIAAPKFEKALILTEEWIPEALDTTDRVTISFSPATALQVLSEPTESEQSPDPEVKTKNAEHDGQTNEKPVSSRSQDK